ncbi:unnamed protein product [Linum trigynum]|uniref:Uncharacterized protein n=1 Tax=Linum trigynum TaxID=586398 RepID=A0AAV2CFD1_9ROSI
MYETKEEELSVLALPIMGTPWKPSIIVPSEKPSWEERRENWDRKVAELSARYMEIPVSVVSNEPVTTAESKRVINTTSQKLGSSGLCSAKRLSHEAIMSEPIPGCDWPSLCELKGVLLNGVKPSSTWRDQAYAETAAHAWN